MSKLSVLCLFLVVVQSLCQGEENYDDLVYKGTRNLGALAGQKPKYDNKIQEDSKWSRRRVSVHEGDYERCTTTDDPLILGNVTHEAKPHMVHSKTCNSARWIDPYIEGENDNFEKCYVGLSRGCRTKQYTMVVGKRLRGDHRNCWTVEKIVVNDGCECYLKIKSKQHEYFYSNLDY